jgi:flagellar basal-body rod protein FlgG
MIRSIWNSRSGMSAQMDKMNAVSNNLSNVNTVGYKRIDVSFDSLVQETLKRNGYPVEGNVGGANNLPYTGTGVKASEFQKDNSQGNLIQTDNNTDLALDGEGFFKVLDGNGNEAYIREGSFGIDSDGTIVDNNGNRLIILNNNGENINVSGIGFTNETFIVDYKGNLQAEPYKNFRIPIYNTMGDNSMKSIGENLYTPETILNENGNQEEVEVFESDKTDIIQGFVENSNVDLGKEMSDMIITQRAFQLNSTALRTADEMWQMANNLKGR